MKKLLLILLCLPLTYFFFTGCSSGGASDNPEPTIESVIVDKKWAGFVPSPIETDLIFELNSDGNLYTYDYSSQFGYSQDLLLGSWLITDQTIEYVYVDNSIEYTDLFGYVADYSDVEIKLVIDEYTNSICSIHDPTVFNPSSSFSCKIDGVQLYDLSPIGVIITTNPALNGALEISGTSNLPNGRIMNTVFLTIYNFSSVTENTYISLGSSGGGQVWQGADIFATAVPNFTGSLIFSKITANKVSGTFNFEAGLTPNFNDDIDVTEGSFTDVSY
jgi:hypothetical protein